MTWIWPLLAFSLFLFPNVCVASSLDLCPLNLNDNVSTSSNITWAQAVDQPIRQFDGPSYLRPDIGRYFCRLQYLAYQLKLVQAAH